MKGILIRKRGMDDPREERVGGAVLLLFCKPEGIHVLIIYVIEDP
jgi:hypothetical protein